jgi:hypothetical protein
MAMFGMMPGALSIACIRRPIIRKEGSFEDVEEAAEKVGTIVWLMLLLLLFSITHKMRL